MTVWTKCKFRRFVCLFIFALFQMLKSF